MCIDKSRLACGLYFTNHTCHQKPNPSRETVPLIYGYELSDKTFLCIRVNENENEVTNQLVDLLYTLCHLWNESELD